MTLILVAELEGHKDRVWQLSWHPSGERLASCSGDRTVRIWAPSDPGLLSADSFPEKPAPGAWKALDQIESTHKRTVRSVAYEPTTGKQIATASFDGTTSIWEYDEYQGYECEATLEGHENEVKCVSWSPSGQLLATCGRDKSVWIWEAVGGGDFDCISVLMEHTHDVKFVTWHPTEEILASVSYDNTVRIWKEDDDDWYCTKILEGHTSTVWSADFSPDGSYLVTVSDDLTVKFWKAPSVKTSSEIEFVPDSGSWDLAYTVPAQAHTRPIYSVSWSHHASDSGNHGLVATGGGDNTLRIFKTVLNGGRDKTGFEATLVEELKNAHGQYDINCVKWNPCQKYSCWLATAGDDGVVRIWYYTA
ncbi:Cytosolic iron-sulfur protein assembly protein [Mycoemilia scoparia]|uniref:Probable cytosolic iron-sulfur protein assembly protein 1 n=1 Tax=Mycoemilia scoparia TaxID=417184 RepID=A0A9W8DW86_9FUNG|nr:Cytosolic iron-sulfur protein assembly protein [Mycoemilia scoparia]